MRKYTIDLIAGLVVGLGFGLFGLLTTGHPWGFGWASELVLPFLPGQNEYGDPFINEYILEPLVYLVLGTILFGIYTRTSFYKRKRPTGLTVLSLLLSFISFCIGIILPYVVLLTLVVLALQSATGPL